MRRDLPFPAISALSGLLLSAAAWPLLPEVMAVHWGASGAADGFLPRSAAAVFVPVLTLLLVPFVTALARRDARLADHGPTIDRLSASVSAFFLGLHLITLHAATTPTQAISLPALLALVGGLLALMGWVIRDVPPNGVIGVRAPFLLADPALWTATQRLGAALLVGAGLSTALAGALLPGPAALAVTLTTTLGAGLAPLLWARTRRAV